MKRNTKVFNKAKEAIVVALILASSTLVLYTSSKAAGVAFFTGATIQVVPAAGGAPGPPTPLCIDPTAPGGCPPGTVMAFSIPSFGLAQITVMGVAAGRAAAPVNVEMIDEDVISDDLLDSHGAGAGPGGAFTIVLHLQCVGLGTTLAGGWAGFEVIRSSGEQTAEVTIEDGDQHIPVGDTWAISCDKQRALPGLPTGSVIDLPWADSRVVVDIPPGALERETVVTLSNALPIPNPPAVPSGFLPVSEALQLEPELLTLAVAAHVALPYTDGEIEGYDEAKLQVLKFDRASGRWQIIPSTVDALNNTLHFQINSFGLYGFAGPPKGGPALAVAQFDTNRNGVIDDPEVFVAIDQWVAGDISDALVLQVIDAWVAQTPVGSSAAFTKRIGLKSVTLRTNATGQTTTFVVNGSGIAAIGVQIFDLSGREIFAQEAVGTKLTWSWSTMKGRLVANGVYLYVVYVRGFDGLVIRTEVKKLVILR